MTDTVYVTGDPLFVDLLNVSCSDPAYVKVGFGGRVIGDESEEGFSTYRVVTHCMVVTYTAKVVDRDRNGSPTRYAVINREYEVF